MVAPSVSTDLIGMLESRHIQFIALGGAIGTGLFLGIGRALTCLTQAGSLSLLMGYSISGAAIFCMMQSLGEMCTWLPLPGAIPQFADRWVDPALGFAIGWNIAAVFVVVQYWEGAQGVNVAVWITILILLVACITLFAVSVYGEVECYFAGIKVIAIIGLNLLAFLIDVGETVQGRIGFRYWKNPGAMKEYVATAFSFGGIETVAVAGGEAKNPRRNIPKAVRRVSWRILFFYVLGALAVGVLVPSGDEKLLSAQANGSKGAAASPWVIVITYAKIKVLPSIINAVILSSASSAANAMTFNGSGYLFALSKNGQAPKVFQKCNKSGFWTFTPWDANSFVTTYIGIPLIAILFCFWKFFKKTKWVSSTEADLYRDKAAIDAIIWEERKPTTIWGKVWDWLC
ncbi:AAT family amino acid transporter [Fusarium agapanthi]|uniref:AAT family amino acid transporter n=1 Tax=Fusarium agapanthi TaxID=1803897 RepID=A0A9P5EG85_9HYPO|nr:AAT family amino acid transporter [Fusarium agapanthi]